ncbi:MULTISPECIES: transposase domain-containing protein [unclassified Endozoicomonas]
MAINNNDDSLIESAKANGLEPFEFLISASFDRAASSVNISVVV